MPLLSLNLSLVGDPTIYLDLLLALTLVGLRHRRTECFTDTLLLFLTPLALVSVILFDLLERITPARQGDYRFRTDALGGTGGVLAATCVIAAVVVPLGAGIVEALLGHGGNDGVLRAVCICIPRGLSDLLLRCVLEDQRGLQCLISGVGIVLSTVKVDKCL
jgi:hypothetical protein